MDCTFPIQVHGVIKCLELQIILHSIFYITINFTYSYHNREIVHNHGITNTHTGTTLYNGIIIIQHLCNILAIGSSCIAKLDNDSCMVLTFNS